MRIPFSDAEIAALPERPAVFLVHVSEGRPYLGKTTVLRRRLTRLLREREGHSRMLNLRAVAREIELVYTGSRLESTLEFYRLARQYFPDSYLKLANLRMPSYVRMALSNTFPRTQVTARLGSGKSFYFGPFRTRATAELFEGQCLDLFQLRRCQDDLVPSPEHPGCIYGEMNMCLRPCQTVVGPEEYATEVTRVQDFLLRRGASLIETHEKARERFSAEMEFEQAARQHKQLERIQTVLKLRDELACDSSTLCGIAVLPSSEPQTVDLLFMRNGQWLPVRRFAIVMPDGQPVSLDKRLREEAAALPETPKITIAEKQEHLAILARWFYSSWRDGEWIPYPISYRRLVGAVHRCAKP